jgi:dipeptidyl aminopeptidase/acylaminoacyl peptidase
MERQAQDYLVNRYDIKYSERLQPGKNPVWFTSQGCRLEGNLFTPSNFDPSTRYPTIITCNPAGAVKEHSAGLYSEKLREHGFILLAFDNRSWGQSEGFPWYTEDPFVKVEDNKNAATFVSCLDCVDTSRIAILGLCSGVGLPTRRVSKYDSEPLQLSQEFLILRVGSRVQVRFLLNRC